MKRPWTKQEEQLLEQQVAEGKSLAEIAMAQGRTPNAVRQKIYVMGMSRRNGPSQWDINMAHALRAEGLTVREIANKLEIKFNAADYIIYHKKPEAGHAVA